MSIEHIVFIGAFIQLIGGLVYVRDTLSGRNKPNRVTWFLWFLAPMIATAVALYDGVGWVVLPVFMTGFIPLLVFVASFFNKDSYWKLTKFDYYCGFFSVSALFFWLIIDDPVLAITAALLADGLAALPTLSKAWKFPETETISAYGATLFSVSLGLLTINAWMPSEYLFSVYLIILNLTMVLIIKKNHIFSYLKI
jgi:hypothetical protein